MGGAMLKLPTFFLGLSGAILAHAQPIPSLRPEGEAPRGVSEKDVRPGSWSSGLKTAFGSSYEAYNKLNEHGDDATTGAVSRVWYSAAQNVLTEVFWPTLDRPQVRDSQLLVSDGQSFLFEERKDSKSTVRWLKSGVPAYEIVNQDPKNRFRIEKIVYSDPSRDAVLIRVRLIRNVSGLKFYWLHNPSVGNGPLGNFASVGLEGDRAGLYAWAGDEAQAFVSSLPFRQVSAGFESINDGYQDLVSDFRMDSHFERASDGNVVTTAWLDVPETVGVTEFVVALAFATDGRTARQIAVESLVNAGAALEQFVSDWEGYQSRVRDLSGGSRDGGRLFRASVALLKAMEDKTASGAFVASPSKPWGQHLADYSSPVSPFSPFARILHDFPGTTTASMGRKGHFGGYHLVWPRDLYQMATSFMALGDYESAVASLNYLRHAQYQPKDGSFPDYGNRRIPRAGAFPQNSWIDGSTYWGGLQMDQVAFPIILTHKLWKAGKISLNDYWDMVRNAANFIKDVGPWTAQERWEESQGASPSTLAAEISALWLAGEMAEEQGDLALARTYWAVGDQWAYKPNDNVEAWTFTTTGGLGNGKYYERIEAAGGPDQNWNPNDESRYSIANGGPYLRDKDVLDGGFLELVRLGVRRARDYHIMETVSEYDRYIRRETSKGASYFRYTEDRYNYDDSSGRQTHGMLWPILTGERGFFELALRRELGQSKLEIEEAVLPYIEAMEAFATPSLMIPEQVWDAGEFQGLPTGAATPLGWAHGEYLKLIASRFDLHGEFLPTAAARSRRLEALTWDQIRKLHR